VKKKEKREKEKEGKLLESRGRTNIQKKAELTERNKRRGC